MAENIASQIERRINHRRAMKQSILRTMRSGAKGIRIAMGGRLRGGEMARREWDRAGRVPLQTLRADIDFGRAEAKTTFGVIGIKFWIYKDLVAPRRRGGALTPEEAQPRPASSRRRTRCAGRGDRAVPRVPVSDREAAGPQDREVAGPPGRRRPALRAGRRPRGPRETADAAAEESQAP